MKRLVIKFLIILIFPLSGFSQNLLDSQCQFRTGGSIIWKNIDFNSEDIRWGKENLIAMRVYKANGNGGITSQDVSLKVNGLDSYFSIKAQFPRKNQIFLNDEKVSFSLLFNNSSNYKIEGKLNYLLINDFKDTISIWNQPLKISPRKEIHAKIDKGNLPSGFYKLYVNFKDYSMVLNFGVNPEKIISPTDRAPDFDNFWLRAKRELAAVDPQFRLIKMDSLSTSTRDIFLVEMRSLDNVLIRGWYTHPKAPGKYAAILHFQGYNTDAHLKFVAPEENMAVFALNIRGHGNSRDDINPGFPGFLTHNLKDKERYIYRGVYMDCIRAVDFLWSRDEVDKRYIIVEGGSQGGALCFATAALDNQRISLCIPHVPFLSDFPDYFKIADWPTNEFADFEKMNKNFGWKGIFQTLSYFDIKNLAGWIRCPVFMAIGLLDKTCPPHINFSAYNQLIVPKSYFVFPNAGHGLSPEHIAMEYDWMKKQLDIIDNSNISN